MLPIVEYLGGYGDKKKATGNLFFYGRHVEFKVALSAKSSFTILNTDITDIAIEGKNEVSRRVTVTRLIAVGTFVICSVLRYCRGISNYRQYTSVGSIANA